MSSHAVYIACMEGALKTLKRLQSSITDIDYAFDCACEFGRLHIVKWLVEQGADVHRFCALGKACKFGHLKVVKFLYKCGARNDTFALQLAGDFGHLNIVKWIYNRGEVRVPVAIVQRMHSFRQFDVFDWFVRVQPEHFDKGLSMHDILVWNIRPYIGPYRKRAMQVVAFS
jgi:hypothetical protein